MSKIIIDNRSSVTDFDAFDAVVAVMKLGRVSNDGKQYCYYTTFCTSDCTNRKIGVSTDLNEKSDRFIISDIPSDQ